MSQQPPTVTDRTAGRMNRRTFTAYGCQWTGRTLERLGTGIGDATSPTSVTYTSDRGGTTLREASLAKLRSALRRLPRPGDPAVAHTLQIEAGTGDRRVRIVLDETAATVIAEGRDAAWVDGIAAQVRDLFLDSGGSPRPIRFHLPFCVGTGLLLGVAGTFVLLCAGWVRAEAASFLTAGSAILLLGAMGIPIGRRRSLRAGTKILLTAAPSPPGRTPMSRSDRVAIWTLAVAVAALAVAAAGIALAHDDAQHEPSPSPSAVYGGLDQLDQLDGSFFGDAGGWRGFP